MEETAMVSWSKIVRYAVIPATANLNEHKLIT